MILTCAIDFIHTGEGLPLDAGLHAYASRMLQTTCLSFVIEILPPEDTLAERLRRRPAKPMGSPRVGSNPTGVDSFFFRHNAFRRFALLLLSVPVTIYLIRCLCLATGFNVLIFSEGEDGIVAARAVLCELRHILSNRNEECGMHQLGIEPGSHRWQRCILPLDH